MKTFTLGCLISLFSFSAFSQAGMYRNYRDFLEDKVIEEFSEYKSVTHSFGNFTATFIDRDGSEVEVKISKGRYWGYRTEKGLVYKINQNADPFLIVSRGVINAYTNFRSWYDDEGKLHFEYGSSFAPTFSVGDNADMKLLKRSKLKKVIKEIGDEEDLAKFKELGYYPSEHIAYISWFNEKYKNEGDHASRK